MAVKKKRKSPLITTHYHPPSPERVQDFKVFLKEFRKHGNIMDACAVLGISHVQIHAWRNQYPEFYHKMEDIRFLVDAEIAANNGSVVRVRTASEGRMITNPDIVKATFLEHFSQHGLVKRAIREMMPNAPERFANHLHIIIHRWKREDPEFAAAMQAAQEMSADVIEEEMHRRGVEGYEEEEFYQGKKVGAKTKYDKTLILALAEARRPEVFGKRVVDAKHIHLHQHNGAADAVATLLDEVIAQRTRQITPPGMVHLIEQDGNTGTEKVHIKRDPE